MKIPAHAAHQSSHDPTNQTLPHTHALLQTEEQEADDGWAVGRLEEVDEVAGLGWGSLWGDEFDGGGGECFGDCRAMYWLI